MTIKVADYIINHLADRGVKDVFVVYGAANGDLIDAFTRNKRIRYVAVMHEQAGGFAAEAYSKIGDTIGVSIATSGPGGMNFVTPLGNCFYDSVPALFITGQVNSHFLRSDPDIRQVGFQESDIVGIVKPVTKYATMLTRAEDVRYELEKALFLAKDARPGPVLLDIPIDIQKKEVDETRLVGFDPRALRAQPDPRFVEEGIDQYLADLRRSERPVMLVGAGVRIAGATDLVLDVATRLNIPCFPTWNALDVIPSDHPCYGGRVGTYGGAGRNFGLQNSDLVLAIGSRISGRITGGQVKTFLRGARKYVVDVDPALLQKKLQQVPCDVPILSDARVFLSRLSERIAGEKLPSFAAWNKRVYEWRDKYDPVRPEFHDQKKYVNPYVFMRMLSAEMGPNDIVVADCGGNIVIGSQAFQTKRGQRYITNNGNSPMGFSHSASMGAYLAASRVPGQNVVCTIGDGGFNMNIQELQTFKNYDLRVKTFIINNHIYGITKAFQETNFDGRMEACGPAGYQPPDFVKICQAYGVRTETITRNADIRAKVRTVLDADEVVVCDVDCHEWHAYEPRIFGWQTPIEDMYPYLPRDEFRANMIIEPVPGWEDPPLPGGGTLLQPKGRDRTRTME